VPLLLEFGPIPAGGVEEEEALQEVPITGGLMQMSRESLASSFGGSFFKPSAPGDSPRKGTTLALVGQALAVVAALTLAAVILFFASDPAR